MRPEISIVIADDHPVFRRGLALMVAADPTLRVVADAADGVQALARIQETRPDIAILDVNMPGQSGLDVARELRRLELTTRVIFLTMHRDEALLNTALDAGARGYLLKESAVEEIVASVKAVAAGENFVSPSLSTFLINRGRRHAALARTTPAISDLTPAERRVLHLIAENRTSREIAAALFISLRTVERHRENTCQKLGLRGSNALLKFAIAHKEQLL